MGNWAGIFVPVGIPGSKFSLDPIFPKGKFSAKRGGGMVRGASLAWARLYGGGYAWIDWLPSLIYRVEAGKPV